MRFYWLAQIKAYLDYGRGLTSWMNELIIFIGGYNIAKSGSALYAVVWAISYGIFCLLCGLIAFKIGFKDSEQEVQNRYNPFVKEMRKSLNIS